jgi:hypothetical protein
MLRLCRAQQTHGHYKVHIRQRVAQADGIYRILLGKSPVFAGECIQQVVAVRPGAVVCVAPGEYHSGLVLAVIYRDSVRSGIYCPLYHIFA